MKKKPLSQRSADMGGMSTRSKGIVPRNHLHSGAAQIISAILHTPGKCQMSMFLESRGTV
jgi:hypothetical protein